MQENSKYIHLLSLLVLLFVYLVFAIPYSPLYADLGYDQEIFQYIGMSLDKGQIPYTDVFDHKPPLIYILNYFGFLLTPNSTWGIYIILNCVGLLSTMLIYKIAKKHTKNVIISLVIAALYICLINSSVFLQGGNYTRQFTTYLTVGILYLILVFKNTKYNSIILGVLLSLIFFTQQNEILGPLILIGYYIFFEKEFQLNVIKKIVAHTVLVFLGFCIPFLGILMLIYTWENYNDFINQVFLFNINNYLSQDSIFFKIARIVYVFGHKTIYVLPLLIVLIIIVSNVILTILKKKKLTAQFIVIGLAFVFQIISTSISGRAFGHYFLMFVPYVVCLLVVSLYTIEFKMIKYSFGILLLSILGYTIQDVSYEKKENKFFDDIIVKTKEVKGLNGQFYSFDASYLRVNFKLNILAPTKWVYTHYLDNSMLNLILQDLHQNQTKFVLAKTLDIEEFDALKLFLDKNYNRSVNNGNHILFEHK